MPRTVGPDAVALPFRTPSFCAGFLRAAEAVGAFEAEPGDPVPSREVSLAVFSPRLNAAVETDLDERVWPVVARQWPYIKYDGLRDAFVIKYAMAHRGARAHPPRRRSAVGLRQAE